MKKEKKNTTLVDRTLDHTSPQFYPGVYVALVTLLSSLFCANPVSYTHLTLPTIYSV